MTRDDVQQERFAANTLKVANNHLRTQCFNALAEIIWAAHKKGVSVDVPPPWHVAFWCLPTLPLHGHALCTSGTMPPDARDLVDEANLYKWEMRN